MTVNEVTSEGLITESLTEVTGDLQNDFKGIYGSDINIDQNSPDGQIIGIFSQAKIDLLDLITQVYNSFDPDVAEGSSLDARVGINGIQRLGGTYPVTPVSITVDRAMTLDGLDTSSDPFTVADDAGNEFYLEETQVISGAGTDSYSFRAAELGAIQTQTNTITEQVTVIVGVTAVNNPDEATVVGRNEESDADLRLRRAVSVSIGSQGSADSLRANLLNTDEVTDAYVWENSTSSTDGQGVERNTVWPIVEGGDDDEIGEVIYAQKGAGCGLKGSETVNVLKSNGEYFEAKFDRPNYVNLYIRFALTAKQAGDTYDATQLKTDLVLRLQYNLYQSADSASIVNALGSLLPNFFPSDVEVSINDADWYEIINASSPQDKFAAAVGRITIL